MCYLFRIVTLISNLETVLVDNRIQMPKYVKTE